MSVKQSFQCYPALFDGQLCPCCGMNGRGVASRGAKVNFSPTKIAANSRPDEHIELTEINSVDMVSLIPGRGVKRVLESYHRLWKSSPPALTKCSGWGGPDKLEPDPTKRKNWLKQIRIRLILLHNFLALTTFIDYDFWKKKSNHTNHTISIFLLVYLPSPCLAFRLPSRRGCA